VGTDEKVGQTSPDNPKNMEEDEDAEGGSE
jgi:hypothetical protein